MKNGEWKMENKQLLKKNDKKIVAHFKNNPK
jgi:hypothetical protein